MKLAGRVLGYVFGYMCLGLALVVTAEAVLRQLFRYSLQGVDELGGYTVAIGSSLAFGAALVGRHHIRIDVLHDHLPVGVQAALNWLAFLLLAAFGVLLAWSAVGMLADTIRYRSTAPTPWATPLVYPQSLWAASLCLFALIAVGLAARATWLLLRRRHGELSGDFQPMASREELREEQADVQRRAALR